MDSRFKGYVDPEKKMTYIRIEIEWFCVSPEPANTGQSARSTTQGARKALCLYVQATIIEASTRETAQHHTSTRGTKPYSVGWQYGGC